VVANVGVGESDHRLLVMGLKVGILQQAGVSTNNSHGKRGNSRTVAKAVKANKVGKLNYKALSRNNYALANVIQTKLEVEMHKMKVKILSDIEAESIGKIFILPPELLYENCVKSISHEFQINGRMKIGLTLIEHIY
jgi:hypothetical protein